MSNTQILTTVLKKGEVMLSGEKKQFETSFLSLQADGNLILWEGTPEAKGKVIWKTQTPQGQGQYFLRMQGDGNLVLRKGTPQNKGEVTWKSNTSTVEAEYSFVISKMNGLFILRGDINEPQKSIVWATIKYALNVGESIESGEEFVSPFSGSRIKMQEDGNLVVRKQDNSVVWDSKTVGTGCCLYLQEDGNMVIRNESGVSVWSSNTGTHKPDNNGVRIQTKYYLHLDMFTDKPVISVDDVIKESGRTWVAGERVNVILTDLYGDYSFEKRTREMLGLPQSTFPSQIQTPVTQVDFMKLPGLVDYSEIRDYDNDTGEEYIVREGITTLKGADHLLGAGIIQFGNCSFQNLNDMKNFRATILWQINFSNCGIIDASAVKTWELPEISHLYFSGNKISNSDFLKNNSFKKLTDISLDTNQLKEINGISSLPSKLNTLTISSNEIVDITPLLQHKDSIATVNLASNKIQDISALLECPNLSYINVRNNPLNENSKNNVIPALKNKGITVFD